MLGLKEIISSSEMLAEGLKQNGLSHMNYKNYTSLDKAMELLLSGYIYLSNGNNWNDTDDRETMKARGTFGTCFSYSTRENVAMWMLYSGDRGKNGAVLNLYPSIIKELCDTATVELGYLDIKTNKFKKIHDLDRSKGEFDIYMTDVVYVDTCKNNNSKLTLYNDNALVENRKLDKDCIFTKKYAWSYEKECRLIVKPKIIIPDGLNSSLRIKLSNKSIAKMTEERIIRSPIYKGKVSYGRDSDLAGKVEWNL